MALGFNTPQWSTLVRKHRSPWPLFCSKILSFPTDKKEKSKYFAVDFKILHNQSTVASLPFFIHWTPLPLQPQSLFFEHTSYLVKN